jgi:transcription antitermination factor NusG
MLGAPQARNAEDSLGGGERRNASAGRRSFVGSVLSRLVNRRGRSPLDIAPAGEPHDKLPLSQRFTSPHEAEQKWYAVWTHSHCEQRVHDQLLGRRFCAFLPKLGIWSRRGNKRHLVQVPMFPGYLFVRHAMDKSSYLEICKTRGLVRVLGERWDRLAVIPDDELAGIQAVTELPWRILPYPYLKQGQRVRITRGPLAGLEGILIEVRPRRGLLVLSVHLLQRSVAVVVDAAEGVPA